MTTSALGGGRSTVQTTAGPLGLREWGQGRPVLLLHGLLVDGHFWDQVVAKLDPARVIVPDLPLGSHRSPMNADADLSPPALARLVAELMVTLDLSDVVLVGADMGGAIAQIVAANHRDRLGALVLNSCDAFKHFFPPTFWYLQAVGYLPGAMRMAGPLMTLPGMYRQPTAFGRVQKRPVAAELARYWLSVGQTAAGRRDLGKVLRGVSRRHTLSAAEGLRDFDRPAHLVWADTNKVFPIADGRRLASLIPHATLTTVPDSYAHIAIDAPDAVAKVINDVLRTGV